MTSHRWKLKWNHLASGFTAKFSVQTLENRCRFVFKITLTVLTSISVEVSREIELVRRENKSRHHHVCSLIEHSSRPISAREIAQLWDKEKWYTPFLKHVSRLKKEGKKFSLLVSRSFISGYKPVVDKLVIPSILRVLLVYFTYMYSVNSTSFTPSPIWTDWRRKHHVVWT